MKFAASVLKIKTTTKTEMCLRIMASLLVLVQPARHPSSAGHGVGPRCGSRVHFELDSDGIDETHNALGNQVEAKDGFNEFDLHDSQVIAGSHKIEARVKKVKGKFSEHRFGLPEIARQRFDRVHGSTVDSLHPIVVGRRLFQQDMAQPPIEIDERPLALGDNTFDEGLYQVFPVAADGR